jgi:hypothetical protein
MPKKIVERTTWTWHMQSSIYERLHNLLEKKLAW